MKPPKADLEQKIRLAIQRWPNRTNADIAKNYKGVVAAEVQAVRETMQGGASKDNGGDTPNMITLGSKPVLDHRPPETVLKYLRRIPVGKAEALEDFAKRIGRSKDKVRQDAKGLGCCKWVDRGNEDWELVVMNPETAKHYND